ncbi:MAG: hypothetical protein AAGE01_18385 [Pseudomonadota bacterium]
MSKLADLLKDMASDAALEAEWKKDREAVLDRYKLTPEERKAMVEKDVDAIKRLSGVDKVKVNSTIKAHDG